MRTCREYKVIAMNCHVLALKLLQYWLMIRHLGYSCMFTFSSYTESRDWLSVQWNIKVLIKFATLAVQINLIRVSASRLLRQLSHSNLFISLFIYLFIHAIWHPRDRSTMLYYTLLKRARALSKASNKRRITSLAWYNWQNFAMLGGPSYFLLCTGGKMRYRTGKKNKNNI